jgi:hypothetical protein
MEPAFFKPKIAYADCSVITGSVTTLYPLEGSGTCTVYDDLALCSTNKRLSAGKATEAVKPQLSVYPNPVAGYLTILTENKAAEEISIFDALVRNVLSRSGHTFDPAIGVTLYLPEHLTGMHTARVIYTDGQIASKTIIIKQ